MNWQFTIISLCFCAQAVAQTPRTVQLADAISLARTNSAQLQKSALDRQSLEKKILENRSIIYPQISAGMDVDAFAVLPTQLIPGEFVNKPGTFIPVQFGQPWHLSGSVNIQQLVFSESYRRGIPARDVSKALFELLTQKNDEEVVANTANVFYQTLQTKEMLRTINANMEKLTSLQKMAQLQFENDYATKTDVKRIIVAKNNLETQKNNLLGAIEGLENTLKFLCGVPLDQGFAPTEPMENPAADSAKWQMLSLDPTTATENRILQKGMELKRIEARVIQAQQYPDFNAYGAGLYQTQRQDANFFDGSGRWFGMVAFGIKARVPLFDGFRRKNKALQLDFDLRKMEADREQLLDAKNLEFAQSKLQLASALRGLNFQRENVALAKEVQEKLLLQYKEGVTSLTDLLNAQTAVSEAETNYWQQVFNYKLAVLKLAKAAGRLEDLLAK